MCAMQLPAVQWSCTSRMALAAPVSRCGKSLQSWKVQSNLTHRNICVHATLTEETFAEETELPSEAPASFRELGIDERLTVMLPELGVEVPSEIQEQAIPAILEGRTLAIQSFTGSGKTLAFLLPVMTLAIWRLEARLAERKANGGEDGGLEAIIVAPSRELAMQTVRVAQQLLPPEAWPLVQQCIGGANSKYQLEALKKNKPLVVIGTPGRLAEHSRSGALRSHRCGSIVMDEVDQLLCPQFRDDMLRLVQHTGTRLPNGPQVVMASATMSKALITNIQSLLGTKENIPIITQQGEFSSGPEPSERASSGDAASTTGGGTSGGPSWGWGQDSGFWAGKAGAAVNRSSAGGLQAENAPHNSMPPQLDHVYVTEVKRHHLDAVRRTVHALNAQRVIVFMNFQDRLRDAMYKLGSKGLPVAVLHGELGKQQRQAVLDGFRSGKYRVLLVSDVVCRGLDVADCDAVINLELPSNPAHYAHRAGRTGRMGRPGTVVNIVEKQQHYVVEKLGKTLGIDLQAGKLTGGQVTVIRDGKVHVLGATKPVPAASAPVSS